MRLRARLLQSTLPLLALVLSGCRDDPVSAASPPAAALTTRGEQERPFYLYQGRPIYLEVDSSGFVVASSGTGDPVSGVQRALSGQPATRLERLGGARDHWVVRLPGRPTREAYQAALAGLRSSDQIGFVTRMYRTPRRGTPVTFVDGLIVRFKPAATAASIDSLSTVLGLRLLRSANPDSGLLSHYFAYPRGAEPLQIAAMLYRHPLVEYAEPDKVGGWQREQASDPFYADQYYLRNSWQHNGVTVDVNAELAWAYTTGDPSVSVWIVDDGIQADHPDLACPGRAIGGVDAYSNGNSPPGESAIAPYANDYHGTAAAGIVGACHNGIGIRGIAPNVTLGSVRIFRGSEVAFDYHIAQGIVYAWSNPAFPASVINLSFGRDPDIPSDEITNAINAAAGQGRGGLGTIVVAAAGNTSDRGLNIIGEKRYPANLETVLAVGAIDRLGRVANYSPSFPDLMGVSSYETGDCDIYPDLVTTDLSGSRGCNFGPPGQGPTGNADYTARFGGTSAAAPQVAAAAALILSLKPFRTRTEVISYLIDRADDWGAGSDYGWGKINIGGTVQFSLTNEPPPPPPPPVTVSVSGYDLVRPFYQCHWYAAPTGGTGPYTYEWEVEGQPVGDGSSALWFGNAGSSFFISVLVRDANGNAASNGMFVTVDAGATECSDM